MPTIRPYSPKRASSGTEADYNLKKELYTQNLEMAGGKDHAKFDQALKDTKSELEKLPSNDKKIEFLYNLSKLPTKHPFFEQEEFNKLLTNKELLQTTWQGKNLMHIVCERGNATQIKQTALEYKKLNPFENPFSGPRRAWIFSKTPLERIKTRKSIDHEEIERFVSSNFQDWSWSIKNIVGYYFPELKKNVEKEIFVGWNQAERHRSNQKRLKALQADPVKNKKEIERLSGYTTKYEDIQKSAKKTREDLKAIGATPLILDTPDGAKLDAAFVSADEFLETLKKAGGKRALIKNQPSGFIFQNAPDLLKNLQDLSLLGDGKPNAKGQELEWFQKELADKRVLLLPNTPENRALNLDPSEVTETDITKDTKSRGTIILTSGALGVYEAHKREIMSFLARGLNVMCFNYRGYGQSTGTPDEQSIHTDIETVYKYLRTLSIKDKDITVKSLCMSGAAGTRLAANYPGVNLLLDQTYTHIKEYLDVEIERMLANMPLLKLIPEKYFTVRGWLARTLADSLSPDWSVQGDIAKVKGRVGVIVTSEDVNTPIDQAITNIQALLDSGNKKITLYPMPGEHADSWMDAKTRDVTPQNFKPETYTNKIPDDRKSLKTQITSGISRFSSATDDKARTDALADLDKLCTPKIIESSHHERVQEALTRLHNDIYILRTKIELKTLEKPEIPPKFAGRDIIDDFFRQTKHFRRLES